MGDGKDVNQRHMENSLPHDPQKEAVGANKAAKIVPIRRELKAVSIAEGFERIITEAKTGRAAMGLTTGHFRLDARLCGLRRKHITTLGGRTSFGKTSKALQICDLNIREHAALYISVEDGESMSLKRLMARRARVNALRLRANRCTKDEIAAMERALLGAEKKPFFVDAVGVCVEDICVFIRQHCKQHDTALVVVDYLQKLKSNKRHQDRRIEVGYYADTLGDTIKECNAAGLLLSQLARPDKNKPDAEPGLYDLKEAGEIENASEHVLIGHVRQESIPNSKVTLRIRQLRICKNKDGPLFDEVIDERFDETTASFGETFGEVVEDPGADDRYEAELPFEGDPRFP